MPKNLNIIWESRNFPEHGVEHRIGMQTPRPSFDAIVEVIAACRPCLDGHAAVLQHFVRGFPGPEVADLREGFLKYVRLSDSNYDFLTMIFPYGVLITHDFLLQ